MTKDETAHQQLTFTEQPAFKELIELAKSPVDLTLEANFHPERLKKYVAKACGYQLIYGTERINDEVMDALEGLAQQTTALEHMHRMQNGEIVNTIEGLASENRPALHTATRDFFDRPNRSENGAKAAQAARAEINKLQNFIEEIDRGGKFTTMIVIGIGGSDLGPRANYLALNYLAQKGRKVHFISNVDPDETAHLLEQVELDKSLIVVISKSGTTLETCTNEAFVKSYFKKRGLSPKEHFIAVTREKSPMDNPENYRCSFYIWDWIGGRYSSTSMVGGVSLAFAFGFDVFWQFLEGANGMDKIALEKNIGKNLPLLGALLGIWNRNFLRFPAVSIIPYSQALIRFPAHIQQLDMESNGKRIDQMGNPVRFETGPIVWGEPGTNSQHSFFQLIHQGTNVVPIEFIGYKESQYQQDYSFHGTTSQEKLLANLFAQTIALATGKKDDNPNRLFPGNRPSRILLARRLDPFSLGALLSYFEHKVAFQGFIWGINSFDQEGVQLGKVLANRILERFRHKPKSAIDHPFPLGDALLKQLDQL